MKHILFFVNSMQPSGGVERVIATLANKLSNFYSITILVKDQPLSFYPICQGIQIISINNPLIFNMDNRLKRFFNVLNTLKSSSSLLKKHLQSYHYDFYYVAHPLSVLEFRLANADFNKLIIAEHGAKVNYNKVYRSIKKLLYKKCKSYVIPTKTDTQLYLLENLPAINIPHFRSALNYKLAEKKNNVVLNIGRFTSDKQQLLLLRMWKKIVFENDCDNWQLYIVGKGELQNDLINYINKNDLNNNVKLLPPQPNVEEFYLNASIFALSSSSEGFGMVLLEAISFGLPCVTFDCPSGPKDIIENGVSGYLIKPADEQSFILHLVQLIKHKEYIYEMGLNAYNRSSLWADESILQKWLKIFN